MSPKTFIQIAAATAVAVIAAGLSLGRPGGDRMAAGTGDAVFPGLIERVNDVASIVIEHAKGRITIEHGDTGWTVKESDGYAARAVRVRRAILGLAQLRLLEPKTRMKEKYAKLDLDDPDAKDSTSRRAQLFDKDGKLLADLIVGKSRPKLPGTTTGGIYMRKPGDEQTWLTAGGADITAERRDWLEQKIVDVKRQRVRRVVIRHPGGETLSFSKASPEARDMTLDDMPAGKKLLRLSGPNAVAGALSNLLLDHVRQDRGPFDPAKTVRADYTTFDGLSVRLQISKFDDLTWIRLEASAEEGLPPPKEGKSAAEEARELKARTGGWIYAISDYAASNLTKRIADLVGDAKPGS